MGLEAEQFRPEAIDPETRAFVAQLERQLAQFPRAYTCPPHEVRAERAAGRGPQGPIIRSERALNRTVSGPAGDISLRILRPAEPEGVYLHIHGGGFVFGGNDMQDPNLEALSTATGLAVVSVNYRLAPEDPYPAGPDDCEAAALWLIENARSEFSTERLLIGGESAGAHLSVLTLLRLRDKHALRPFLGANLAFGVYDLSGTPSTRAWGERFLVLNTPLMAWYGDMFVSPERQRDPDVSPLYADLKGLPLALFSVGTLDPLLDDSLFMYARWLAAGNEAELAVYPGGTHGITGQPTALGKRAFAMTAEFLRTAVAQAARAP